MEDTRELRAQGVLADRVDGEPPAILGLSTSEILIVSGVVGLVCLPATLLLGAMFGAVQIALGLTGFLFLGGVYGGSVIFRRLKRGRPIGYYQVRLAILMQRMFGGNKFILRGGSWDLGRSAPMGRKK